MKAHKFFENLPRVDDKFPIGIPSRNSLMGMQVIESKWLPRDVGMIVLGNDTIVLRQGPQTFGELLELQAERISDASEVLGFKIRDMVHAAHKQIFARYLQRRLKILQQELIDAHYDYKKTQAVSKQMDELEKEIREQKVINQAMEDGNG